MNDIYDNSVQQFLNNLNQEENLLKDAIELLNDAIERKEEELQKLKELLEQDERKLTRKRITKGLVKHHTKKLSDIPLEGLPVSLDGGDTWHTVTSKEADEHGNITILDRDSTRSVAIEDVTPAPLFMHRAAELHQAPVGTTVFFGRETFKKVDDTAWLKHCHTTSYMDEDEWGEDDVETSKVSTEDMEEEIRNKDILMVKSWGEMLVRK